MSETPEALKLKIAKLEGKIQMLDESNTKLSQENAALNNKIGTLDNQLEKECELRLALKWPVESRQVIDHFEEKYGKYIQLTPAEKSTTRQVNPNVDF